MFEKYKGKTMHPEFIQDDVTIENLLHTYKAYNRENFLENSKELREYLGHGSSKNVARLIVE
jgi:lipid-A-disaccharide synthase